MWAIVSLAGNLALAVAGFWGWLKYRQAWRAGWQACEAHAAKREAQRAKDRQGIEAAVRARGDGVVGDVVDEWSRD